MKYSSHFRCLCGCGGEECGLSLTYQKEYLSKLFGILLLGRFFSSFLNQFIHSLLYVSMDSGIFYSQGSHLIFILLLRLFQFRPLGVFQAAFYIPLITPQEIFLFLEQFTFSYYEMLQCHLFHPFLQVALAPFHWRRYLKTKFWLLGVFIATWVSLLLVPQQKEVGNMCMYTNP